MDEANPNWISSVIGFALFLITLFYTPTYLFCGLLCGITDCILMFIQLNRLKKMVQWVAAPQGSSFKSREARLNGDKWIEYRQSFEHNHRRNVICLWMDWFQRFHLVLNRFSKTVAFLLFLMMILIVPVECSSLFLTIALKSQPLMRIIALGACIMGFGFHTVAIVFTGLIKKKVSPGKIKEL